jgi:hypothetical protein
MKLTLKNHLWHQKSPRQPDLNGLVRHDTDITSVLEHTGELLLRTLLNNYVINQVSSSRQNEASSEESPSASEESSATRSKWSSEHSTDIISALEHTGELLLRTLVDNYVINQLSIPQKMKLALKNHLRHQRSPRQLDLNGLVSMVHIS